MGPFPPLLLAATLAGTGTPNIAFVCSKENDLYQALLSAGQVG